MTRTLPILLALILTAACQSTSPDTAYDRTRTPAPVPPDAAPGTCWGKVVSPAVVETVTEQVLVEPAELAEDGTTEKAAVYRTETRQDIVRERKETWFETPCANALTPEFVASLQRALEARGFYRGTITGVMDVATRVAVRAYQSTQGLDSETLSLDAARKLGLIAIKRN